MMIFSKELICNCLLPYPERDYIDTMQFFLIFLIFPDQSLVRNKLYSTEWFMIGLLFFVFFFSFSGLKDLTPTVLSLEFHTLSKS